MAWGLLVITAVCYNGLVGYRARGKKLTASLLIVLTVVIGISLLLIADIHAPRGGLMRIKPQNLVSLAQSVPNSKRWKLGIRRPAEVKSLRVARHFHAQSSGSLS